MAPLLTLLVTYVLTRIWLHIRGRQDNGSFASRLALAVMLVLTGLAHFTSTDAMAQMLPPSVPGAVVIVYATGLVELAAAARLVWRMDRPVRSLGWGLALFFLALLPANIYSAIEEVGLGGHGAMYLWFRVPLQILFIGWALLATGAISQRRSSVAIA